MPRRKKVADEVKPPDRLLTPSEASDLLGLKPRTLRDHRRRGHIPFVRMPGGRLVRYRLKSLMELIERREVGGDSE